MTDKIRKLKKIMILQKIEADKELISINYFKFHNNSKISLHTSMKCSDEFPKDETRFNPQESYLKKTEVIH